MRATTLLTSALLAVCSSAAAITTTADLSVPGDNPLEYCSESSDYILSINKIDIDPNPPQAGKNMTITFTGKLLEEVEKGAYVLLEVKYGSYIKLVNEKMDICENAEAVDKKCPVEKGDVSIEKIVSLPAVIPSGTYYVQADAYTKDDKRITCLKAGISFGANTGMLKQAAGMVHQAL